MAMVLSSIQEQILSGLGYLSGQCDFAHERDHKGFSAVDAQFGNKLAACASLSLAQMLMGAKMLQKYRQQLEKGGLKVPALSDVEVYVGEQKLAAIAPVQSEEIASSEVKGKDEQIVPRVYIHKEQRDEWIIVEFPYDREKYNALAPLKRTIKGWKFNQVLGRKEWAYPRDTILQVLDAIKGFDDFEYDPEIAAIVAQARVDEQIAQEQEALQKALDEQTKQVALETIQPYLDGEALPNGRKLFEHQKDGVRRLINGRRMILAHDMGLGKSLSSLVAAKGYGLHIIVICPASLKINWLREAEGVGVQIEVWSWAKLPDPPEIDYVLIGDEAHFCQSLTSQRSQAFLKLAEQARAVFALSGTPLKNGRPINLFPLLIACQHKLAEDKRYYEKQYCNGRTKVVGRREFWDVTGASHLDELHKKTADIILYKKKEECLKDLPPKIRVMRQAEVSADDKKASDALLAQLRSEQKERIQDKRVMALAALKADLGEELTEKDIEDEIKRLEEDVENARAIVELGNLRHAGSLAKCQSAIELAQEALEQGESIVLFTAYRDTASRLSEALQSDCLTGDTTTEQRQDMIDRFQAKQSRVLVCMLGAGGVGITLTAAQTVVLVDRPWTPGDTVQSEDRCHRIGQLGSVTAIWLQYGEIDLKVDALLQAKQERIDLVLTGKRKTMRGVSGSIRSMAKDILKSIESGQDLDVKTALDQEEEKPTSEFEVIGIVTSAPQVEEQKPIETPESKIAHLTSLLAGLDSERAKQFEPEFDRLLALLQAK